MSLSKKRGRDIMGISTAIFLLLFLFSLKTDAQIYPETLWVPVTFYDFHSDGSNPEFEVIHKSGRHLNMVDTYLDANRKPVVGSKPYINYYIKYWFRPWSEAAKGDSTIPVYTCVSRCNAPPYEAEIRYDGIKKVNHDTAFKNIVIKDSLPFILDRSGGSSAGTYFYRNDNFFPLDNRGFGREGKNHNFSFTMELNWKFVKVPGLRFIFRGDDDVWVFINGKLVMDIGGIHEAISDTLYIDSLTELEYGKEYTLDLFYAERHTIDSRIWITSNIIAAAPKKMLQLNAYPNDTICPGEKVTIVGVVVDEHGQRQKSVEKSIQWRVLPLGPNNNSNLTTLSGDTTILSPIGTNQLVGVEGKVRVEDTTIIDTVWIFVKICSQDTTPPNIPPVIPPTIPPESPTQGPYVKKAIYKIGPLGEMFDTLQILFSEPVRCDSLKKNLDPSFSFKVYDPENRMKTDALRGSYYIDGDLCLADYITEVSLVIKANKIIPLKDSIKLVGITVDKDGNPPDTTKRGAIDYEAGSGINIVPISPENGSSSPMIISKGISLRTGIPEGKEGKVIVISTRGPLVSTVIPASGELSYGKAIIYDAVANVVAVDLPIKQFPNNERLYYILWDGTNRQKRKVSSGSYLLRTIVQYKDEPHKNYIEQRKFIVKWK